MKTAINNLTSLIFLQMIFLTVFQPTWCFFVYSLTEKNFLTRRLFLIISCYISYRLALLKKTLKRSYPKMEWNALRIFLLSYLLLLHIRLLFRSILDFLKRKKLNSWGKKSLFSLCTEQYSHCI